MTLRNFMSVGNVTQAVNFDTNDLTLIVGENLDISGGEETRNGTGKTSILNGLSYGLYGQAISNIKKDNLINLTNGKNMLVTIDFEIGNTSYRIERGRKPAILKFYVNGESSSQSNEDDDSQGESKETQDDINEKIGMSHDMFRQVLALNTYTEPFLAMRAAPQREIIEQLLGITMLSEKAERLKGLIKTTKDAITEEEYRIKSVQDSNQRIAEQIENLKKRQNQWVTKRESDIADLAASLESLKDIDIARELELHKAYTEYHELFKLQRDAHKWVTTLDKSIRQEEKKQASLSFEIEELQNHRCYACGSDFHDEKQEATLATKIAQLEESVETVNGYKTQHDEYSKVLSEIGDLSEPEEPFYRTVDQAREHQSSIEKLTSQIETKLVEEDPYAEQIEDMQATAIQEVSWDLINEFGMVREHQDFLLKLLTNKDSFVRKTIIEQNLAYLNSRLQHYLNQSGLPHSVKFQNDLTVQIEEFGRELDFHNLSRGEMTRLVLSLNFAFRDVFEGLYHPINLLFIDEVLDNGMDVAGVESIMQVLKKMCRERMKAVFLVSHRTELIGRVQHTITAVKSNGFTTYNVDGIADHN